MNKLLFAVLVLLFSSCSSSKLVLIATQGDLSQHEFNRQIDFYYKGGHIFIDVSLNDSSYTFLFDTGYEITMIDQSLSQALDFKPIKQYKTEGSSFKTQRIQYGFLSAVELDGISFQNIGIGIQDLSFIKSPFSDKRKIAGIIGTNILRKVYWQLNYNRKTIQFSDKLENLTFSSDALVCIMTPRNSTGWGYNNINVNLNNIHEEFIFDTGFSGSFMGNFELLDKLQSNDSRIKSNDNFVHIDQLTFGEVRLENVPLTIKKGVKNLIGNKFLEAFIVTIDWKNNTLYLSS
ncbi:aspartyl protease family protein [Aureispira anguillae]|uniref:Aspartyl protease family protein n=1 Tax=Aureispira anguillae TaxID=2864201 RepID=A0A916DT50_9BACT|nr:aspartyl protease family protein [Aureispira anguillae]BDS11231.1 aspartyl protease family protein [Aureispira anguillae]